MMKKALLLLSIFASFANVILGQVVEVSGDITNNTTWTSDKIYLLKGFVYVKEPAVLTIEPGTIIKGDKPTKGSLIIERGAKIMAEGTQAKPIVFTSNQPAGSRDYGDWGGIIILGKSLENQPGDPTIEGGVSRAFGGTDPADNSGVLKYVRVEFPGIAFTTDNEINGITLGAVGSQTVIDYVQVSICGDDSFEWFGGTVNAKHLISYAPWDDNFDADFGYSGNVQYALAIVDPTVSDVSGSNGFETDGDAQGNDVTPLTAAQFANVTIYGPLATSGSALSGLGTNYKRALHIRRNSSLSVYNSVFMGYPVGLYVDNTGAKPVSDNIQSGSLKFMNNVFSGIKTPADTLKYEQKTSAFTRTQLDAWFVAAKNMALAENAALGLPETQGNLSMTSPKLLPNNGSVLLSGGATLPEGFEQTSYRGAFNDVNWTEGWANFDPQNTPYLTPGATNVNEAKLAKGSLQLVPNPANERFNILFTALTSQNATISVIDAFGKTVVENVVNVTNGENVIPINVTELEAGVYNVKLVTESQVAVSKVLVNK